MQVVSIFRPGDGIRFPGPGLGAPKVRHRGKLEKRQLASRYLNLKLGREILLGKGAKPEAGDAAWKN